MLFRSLGAAYLAGLAVGYWESIEDIRNNWAIDRVFTPEMDEEKQQKLAANNVAEQEITLGVRPEHITLEESGIDAKIDVSEMMGSSVHLHITAMGRDVVVVVSTMNMTGAEVAALCGGAKVGFDFSGSVCHVFNKETGINLEA